MASPTNRDLERGNQERMARPEQTKPESGNQERMARPEERITLFAVRLAILEKAASGLASLDFIWATVVVLGGFATSIETIDFWFVTIISLIEGTRIVRRSEELEWKHKITSNKSEVPLVPGIWGLFKAKNVSRWFLCLQILSVLACAVLSLFRLCKQSYGVVLDSSTKNRKSALNIFYGLSLADAFLYLLQKICWKILKENSFPKLKSAYEFVEPDEIYSLFSETYSRCIKGSVLDGLGMEFVQYGADLLLSGDDKKQLRGAQILSAITKKEEFKDQTLRATKKDEFKDQTLRAIGDKQEVRVAQILSTITKKEVSEDQTLKAIGDKQEVVERLIQMLNCREQKEIRKTAARIVADMVGITNPVTSNNSFIESVGSLLYDSETIEKDSSGDYNECSVLGLRILQAVEDKTIIERIIRSLLPKIIGMIKLKENAPSMSTNRVSLSLELLKKLREKNESLTLEEMKKINLECICNLSDILQHWKRFPHGILILAIDTLKALAETEDGVTIDDARKGVLYNLFSMLLMVETNNNKETERLVTGAGEALVVLSGNNERNCKLMMDIELGHDHPTFMARLISVVDHPLRGIAVARILRNLCVHAKLPKKNDAGWTQLMQILEDAPKVLGLVTEKRDKHQEAAIGLAAQLLWFMEESDFKRKIKESTGVTITVLISEILGAVGRNRPPPNDVTKFSFEFLIEISKKDKHAIKSSMSKEVREQLKEKLNAQVRCLLTPMNI